MEDMEQAVEESRSAVSVRSTAAQQRPLGDVNEYDDEDEEEMQGAPTKEVSDSACGPYYESFPVSLERCVTLLVLRASV